MACINEKDTIEDWTIEPFAIEHMEYRIQPDSAVVFYVNRNMQEDTGYTINIDATTNSGKYVHGFALVNCIKKGNTLVIPVANGIKDTTDYRFLNNFRELLLKHFTGKDTIQRIALRTGLDITYAGMNQNKLSIDALARFCNQRSTVFIDEELMFPSEDVLTFRQTDVADSMLINLKQNTGFEYWNTCLYKNYQGEFDAHGNKQGAWKWFYSNGHKMLEGNFYNDSLTAPLKRFRFNGEEIVYSKYDE